MLLMVGVLQCVSSANPANPAKPENEGYLAHLCLRRFGRPRPSDASATAVGGWQSVGSDGQDAAGAPQRAAPGASDSISGDALLGRVLAAVDGQRSISAKVRHKVDLLGREVLGSGIYLQQGRGAERQLRLELKLQTAGTVSSVQQICDGSNLWVLENVAGRENLLHVDVARLRRARPKSPTATVADGWLGLGGLPKLLAGLDGSFRFSSVAESRLEELRVWTLEGQWEPAKLAALLPDQKDAILAGGAVDLTKLAPNLPDRVVVHVGCDDLFPYRIEYWRGAAGGKGAKTAEAEKLLVLMELYEVRLGAPIDPQQFTLPRSPLKPVDRTQAYLDKLGLEEETPAGARQKSPPRR